MKKFFAFLAAALLVVACGGTKEEPKTIEDQMLDHIAKIEKAVKAGDFEKAEAASEAFDEWGYSLNDEQMMEAIEAMEKYEERITKLMLAYEELEYAALEDEYYGYEEYYDEAVETAGEYYDEAVDAAGEYYDEAVEAAGEYYEKAVETAGEYYEEAAAAADKYYKEASKAAEKQLENATKAADDYLKKLGL